MTSATDKLRRLLDERGVEYKVDERNAITEWSTYYGAFVFFARQREGKLLVETTVATEHSVILTPEQAIAATLGEPIIRCRDCRHATISTMGVCKYCEMFVLPDTDGYGADPQVNLPLDFFCGFAERKEVD